MDASLSSREEKRELSAHNEKKEPTPQDVSTTLTEHIARTVFTEEEVADIIKGFIIAYMRGTITVNFPDAEFLMWLHKEQEGEEITTGQALKESGEDRVRFRNLVGITTGATPSTQVELKKATEELFQSILALRNGQRIEGEFSEFRFEQKIVDLEKNWTRPITSFNN